MIHISEEKKGLEGIKFLVKKAKPKARAEYTYHATKLAKRYASSITKMIEETKQTNETEIIILEDPEVANKLINQSIEKGFESPGKYLEYLADQG